jgi:hypothetical protein
MFRHFPHLCITRFYDVYRLKFAANSPAGQGVPVVFSVHILCTQRHLYFSRVKYICLTSQCVLLITLVANTRVTTETRLWICLQCGNIVLAYQQTNLTRQAIRVLIKHHHNTYGGDEVHFHAFLTSALPGVRWYSRPVCFLPEKGTPTVHRKNSATYRYGTIFGI